jgi:hypothetical protein
MNGTYQQPNVTGMETEETDFSHIFGPGDWNPKPAEGPFLPINSSGKGRLPYKIADSTKSTFIDYSKNLMYI